MDPQPEQTIKEKSKTEKDNRDTITAKNKQISGTRTRKTGVSNKDDKTTRSKPANKDLKNIRNQQPNHNPKQSPTPR